MTVTLLNIKDINKLAGKQFGKLHDNLIFKLVSEAIPRYPWLPWKFSNFPSKELLSNTEHWEYFIHHIEGKLRMKELNDWDSVKSEVNLTI